MAVLDDMLDGSIDYAGLFPPAGLPMPEAVRNHASYLRGPHRRLLGRFIVPLARLGEFEAVYATLHGSEQEGWRLSALAGPDPAADRQAINAFHARRPDARIVAVETKASNPTEVASVAAGFPPSLEVWIEVPAAGDIESLITTVKSTGRGAKLRTGGVTAAAFPPAADVVRFLAACHRAGIVAKATAGLHHPVSGDFRLTYESASPFGTMFGFVNLFLAAALVARGGPADEAAVLLAARDPASFRLTPDSLSWRRHAFSGADLAGARRSLLRSFGSCSFTEPVEGLQSLGWL